MSTSEESCFNVCVRFRDASANALVSNEAWLSELSPLWGHPLIGRSLSQDNGTTPGPVYDEPTEGVGLMLCVEDELLLGL